MVRCKIYKQNQNTRNEKCHAVDEKLETYQNRPMLFFLDISSIRAVESPMPIWCFWIEWMKLKFGRVDQTKIKFIIKGSSVNFYHLFIHSFIFGLYFFI